MKSEDLDKINELLESTASKRIDANTIVYINNMLKKAQKELIEEVEKEYHTRLSDLKFGLYLKDHKSRK